MSLSSFIITSRETLEAALVVGIVLSYLTRTGNEQLKKTVYWGVGLGIGLSVLFAVGFSFLAGGFTGVTEKLFEGVLMIFAATLLTTMILWMMKQKNIAQSITDKVQSHINKSNITKGFVWGIFILIVISVLREGIETVIFLHAISSTSGISLIGGFLGIVVAIIVGYLFFKGSKKIKLSTFFNITSVMLILIAGGLAAHGIHELQEGGVVPIVVKEVWDINPAVTAAQAEAGNYPLMHESGAVGGFLKGIFGYNGNPTLIEVLVYVLYIAAISYVYFGASKRKNHSAKID